MNRGLGAGGYSIAEDIVRLPVGPWEGEPATIGRGSGKRGAWSVERGAGQGEKERLTS